MRESPYPEHRLLLNQYLTNPSGEYLLGAAAASLDTSPNTLPDLLRRLPKLQIFAPISVDRVLWTGEEAPFIWSHLGPRDDFIRKDSISVFLTTTGLAQKISPMRPAGTPIIEIGPADDGLEATPSATVSSTTTPEHTTISTTEETFSLQTNQLTTSSTFECNPDTSILECPEDPSGGGEIWDDGIQLSNGFTFECFVAPGSSGDADGDGILQQCENELVDSFKPYLQWDNGERTSQRQSYWAIRPHDSVADNVRKIIYMFGYFEDGGGAGGLTAHDGDAEFIVMTVVYRNSWWRMTSAFLSAHWGAFGDSSDTYPADAFEYPGRTQYARPLIWVAENKHANYPDQSTCDQGGFSADNCDNPITLLDGYGGVMPERNAGNRESGSQQLLDCVLRTAHGGGTRFECLWSGLDFAGWQDEHAENSLSYGVPLDAFNF